MEFTKQSLISSYIRDNSGIDVTCSQVQDLIDRFYDTSKAFEQDMELFSSASTRSSTAHHSHHPSSTLITAPPSTTTNIHNSPVGVGAGADHRRRGTSHSPRKQTGAAARSSGKRGGKYQPSPSPAPRDQRSNSIASSKKGMDYDDANSDHGLGIGIGDASGGGLKTRNHEETFIEFSLPPEDFEELIENARKSNVESVGGGGDDGGEEDDIQLDDPNPSSKKGSGRKRSPVRQKSSSAVSSPSQTRRARR